MILTLNALSDALTSTQSPLAANLASTLSDATQELVEAELSALAATGGVKLFV